MAANLRTCKLSAAVYIGSMTERTPPIFPLPDAPIMAEPEALSPETAEEPQAPQPKLRLEPTRYGDWELAGKCVDF